MAIDQQEKMSQMIKKEATNPEDFRGRNFFCLKQGSHQKSFKMSTNVEMALQIMCPCKRKNEYDKLMKENSKRTFEIIKQQEYSTEMKIDPLW
eukprot:CAMPEP_0116873306 /NCGR_PEP_ID=MMETSP0463-20121206/4348_1 /TAXON_ID=181622 /ORGANISM="Strombidinopsis sp, Strain SopsisLIS2011" /LENGTH=92 /DNA_ID=CAMNT_0004514979 /DNA_START=1155 /DNA_END=1430 /DNA_ORIENTATION=-